MKRIAVGLSVLLGSLALALVAMLKLFPGDVVERTYASLDAARQDQLFDGGWLPDVLPPSTSQIHLENDLNLNTSSGSFNFSAGEWPLLQSRLTSGALTAPFVDWNDTVEGYRRTGFVPWHHTEKDGNWTSHWVFFCNHPVGRCEHFMWMRREG